MKVQLDQLISQLHDAITDQKTSPEVARLMRNVDQHVQQWDEKNSQTDMAITMKQLLAELEVEHSQAVAIVRKMVDLLAGIGV